MEKEQEEICLVQETIRLVEICTLMWWVHIQDFWFQQPHLCELTKSWADGFYMCGFQCETQRSVCNGVEVLFWCYCLSVIQTPPILQWHNNSSALWEHQLFRIGQWPQTHLQAIWLRRRVLHQRTWPPQSPTLNATEMPGVCKALKGGYHWRI